MEAEDAKAGSCDTRLTQQVLPHAAWHSVPVPLTKSSHVGFTLIASLIRQLPPHLLIEQMSNEHSRLELNPLLFAWSVIEIDGS